MCIIRRVWWLRVDGLRNCNAVSVDVWALSSNGRAPASHAGGRGIDTPSVHSLQQNDYGIDTLARLIIDLSFPILQECFVSVSNHTQAALSDSIYHPMILYVRPPPVNRLIAHSVTIPKQCGFDFVSAFS